MHTHFGSATHLISTFFGVLIVGTVWRVGWLHTLAAGHRRNSKMMQGLSKAALFQY